MYVVVMDTASFRDAYVYARPMNYYMYGFRSFIFAQGASNNDTRNV